MSLVPANPAAADTGPPTVSITSPAAPATVFGGIQVKATASDDTAVAGVQFFLDSAPLGAEDLTPPYAAVWNTATSANGVHTLTARARDTSGLLTLSAPVSVTVSNDGSPAQIGQWAAPVTLPIVAVHMNVLPNGELLIWDAWDLDDVVYTWNPSTQAAASVTTGSGPFCAAHTLLPDGRVFIVGGHPHGEDDVEEHEDVLGLQESNAFDWGPRSWTRLADMRFRRWYGTTVPLSNGRVLVLSGQVTDTVWSDTPELYDPATGRWKALPAVNTSNARTFGYLDARLLPDGIVSVLNPEDGRLHRLDVGGQRWLNDGTISLRYTSSAMYRPGQILVTGGGNNGSFPNALPSALLVDAAQSASVVRPTTPMRFARQHHNLVMLPTGEAMVVGGSDIVATSTFTGPLQAESWSPATEAWTTLAAQRDLRMYHSTAALLPDGRVVSAGGGHGGTNNNYFTLEFYSPAYLFRGPRPVITSAPATLSYGQPFTVQTPDAAAIASVALLPLGAVTHTINSNQRYIELSFTQTAGALTVHAPTNLNLVVPGHYLLFLVNGAGVPSVASVVQFPLPPQPPETGVEAFQEVSGQVVLEAEHFDERIARSGRSWDVDISQPGYSRTAYVQASPNAGMAINAGYATTSPELVFNVQFASSGTYYVWARGVGDTGSDDSLHVGLDGTGPASADRIASFGTGWTWKRSTMDGPVATLVIPAAGLHTIHVWMREDGAKLDKLLLRKSSSSTAPSGTGPAESGRVVVGALPPPPPPPGSGAFQESGGQVVMQAENYDDRIDRSGKSWTLETSRSGFSGAGYLGAKPNTGGGFSSGYVTASPELVFNVNFTTTGTYYVWVRGSAQIADGDNDSVHAGLDGTGPPTADGLNGFNTTSWVWKRQTLDGVAPTLQITTPGLHTIHLWMREDGMLVDKLLLRKSSSSTAPTGTGPAESPRAP